MDRSWCWPGCIAVLILAALCMAAPPAPPQTGTLVLRTDPDLDALIAQARQLLEARDFRSVIEICQGLIEKGGDRVVVAAALDSEGARSALSAAAAARQMLMAAPTELRSAYSTRFEPQARADLDSALARHDIEGLRRLADRFPIVPSSQSARAWLGAMLADTGEYSAATEAFAEFIGLQELAGTGNTDVSITLAQQVFALAKSGDIAGAQETLKKIRHDYPEDRKLLGGKEQKVVDFAAERLEEVQKEATRHAEIEPLAPTPRWTIQDGTNLSPLVAGDDERLYFRSPTTLTCVEVASGKRFWQSTAPLLTLPITKESLRQPPEEQATAIDLPRFALTASPNAVFYIENYPNLARLAEGGVWPGGPVPAGGPGKAARTPQEKYAGSSQLTSRDSTTGRLRWRIGRGEGRDDFAKNVRWLSRPTVDRNRLYIIALHIQSYFVVCIDANEGRILWRSFISQRPEASNGWPAQSDLDHPSPPLVVKGRVLCLTNSGVVGCFDRLTGDSRWFCQYLGRPSSIRAAMMRSNPTSGAAFNSIFAAGRKVVVAPADSEDLFALEIDSGDQLWRHPRGSHQFLAGIEVIPPGRTNLLALLAGADIQALKVEDGTVVWATEVEVAKRPVLSDDTLHLLQNNGALIQLSAANGKLLSSQRISCESGQLLAVGSHFMLHSRTSIGALWSFKEAFDSISRSLEAAPKDVSWLLARADLNLRAGRATEALTDLAKARSMAKEPKEVSDVETRLFRCYMVLAQSEPDRALAFLKQALPYAFTNSEQSERFLRLADAHAARQDWTSVAVDLQSILDTTPECWIEIPAGGWNTRSQNGSVSSQESRPLLAGGLVSNRAWASHALEELVAAHGLGVYARVETEAKRRFQDARSKGDMAELRRLTEQYPVGESQEQARMALAELRFAARQYDLSAETLLSFLLAQPKARHAPDAILGLALSGMHGQRRALAQRGLNLLADMAPQTETAFATVSGKAGELSRSLKIEIPSPTAQAQEKAGIRSDSGRRINVAPGSSLALGGDHLAIVDNMIVRTVAETDRVLWRSAPLSFAENAPAAGEAARYEDTIVLRCDGLLVALDADSGKLLWQRRYANPGRSDQTSNRRRARQRMLVVAGAGGAAANQPAEPDTASPLVLFRTERLLWLTGNGKLNALSPRRGEPMWTVRLPKSKAGWTEVQSATGSRWLALTSDSLTAALTHQVAVVDLWRGEMLAVWDVPNDASSWTVRDDGSIKIR